MKTDLSISTLSLLIDYLQEIRLLLRSNLNDLPKFHSFCISILQNQRDIAMKSDLGKMPSMQKTVTKALYMFLLSCHDTSLEQFIDSSFENFDIHEIEYFLYQKYNHHHHLDRFLLIIKNLLFTVMFNSTFTARMTFIQLIT